MQKKAISLVAVQSKEWWLVQENHATVKLDSKVASRRMKTYSEGRTEVYKSWRKCRKNRNSFCHQSSPVSRKGWTLPWILQELKITFGKVAVTINTGGHSIRVLNERTVSDGRYLCPLWSETLTTELQYSLPWALLCSLLWPEKDWKIRVGKQSVWWNRELTLKGKFKCYSKNPRIRT